MIDDDADDADDDVVDVHVDDDGDTFGNNHRTDHIGTTTRLTMPACSFHSNKTFEKLPASTTSDAYFFTSARTYIKC